MFGYVKTDLPNMYMKDNLLYKSLYCGLCKGIGKCCGQRARMLLSYDLTFLSAFLHNVNNVDVVVKKQRCVLHHIIPRPIAVPDDLTKRIGSLNVLLGYHKLNDDVLDSGKGKIKRTFFKKSYKKAKKHEPILDSIVDKWYKQLLEYEKQKIDSIDICADPFGQMIAEVVKELCDENFDQNIYDLSYKLGKWIYLIDAIDDYDKDIAKGNFNVFVNSYKAKDKNLLITNNAIDIVYIFSELLMGIEKDFYNIKFHFNNDLIKNILILGLKEQTKLILESKKCKNTTKY